MVNVKYRNALSEVEFILKYTDEELLEKIPQKIKNFIKENKNYLVNIKQNENLANQELLPETQAILALIYRSYFASQEEKNQFALNDAIEIKEMQKKNKEQIEKIFKEKKQKQEVTSLVVVKKENWFQKLWSKLKKVLDKNEKKI